MIEFWKKYNNREFYAIRMRPSDPVSEPLQIGEFACLVIINNPSISPNDQTRISKWIVESQARYAVCVGYECSTWDDSIDFALLEKFQYGKVPDEHFVMTSWHENESIDDILSFFILNTSFDYFNPEKYVIIQIGDGELLDDYKRRLDQYFGGLAFA